MYEEPKREIPPNEVACPHCGCDNLDKFAAGGYVQAKCTKCRRQWTLGIHAPGDLVESVVIPSDGGLPHTRYRLKSHLAPASSKRLEFEDGE